MTLFCTCQWIRVANEVDEVLSRFFLRFSFTLFLAGLGSATNCDMIWIVFRESGSTLFTHTHTHTVRFGWIARFSHLVGLVHTNVWCATDRITSIANKFHWKSFTSIRVMAQRFPRYFKYCRIPVGKIATVYLYWILSIGCENRLIKIYTRIYISYKLHLLWYRRRLSLRATEWLHKIQIFVLCRPKFYWWNQFPS